MTYYTVYKITNLINGKIYIGCHKTNNLDDDYMGSGKILGRAKKKYGIENFKKEYIQIHETSEAMFDQEAQLVNKEFVVREDTYNIKEGGSGGFDYVRSHPSYHDWQLKAAVNGGNTRHISIHELGKRISDGLATCENRYAGTNAAKIRYPKSAFYNKHHTDKAKQSIGAKNSIHQSGEGNSQFGTRWIYNIELKESKKIKKTEQIPDGWKLGRKIKY